MSARRPSLLLCLVILTSACGADEGETTPGNGYAAPASTTTVATTLADTLPTASSPVEAVITTQITQSRAEQESDQHESAPPADAAPETEPVRSPQPVAPVQDGMVGEVPGELMRAIRDDAAAATGYSPGDFTVIRAEPVVWSDGSLGCPQPGVIYTQALVDGYLVVLQRDATRLEYHAAATGAFTACPRVQGKPGAP